MCICKCMHARRKTQAANLSTGIVCRGITKISWLFTTTLSLRRTLSLWRVLAEKKFGTIGKKMASSCLKLYVFEENRAVYIFVVRRMSISSSNGSNLQDPQTFSQLLGPEMETGLCRLSHFICMSWTWVSALCVKHALICHALVVGTQL